MDHLVKELADVQDRLCEIRRELAEATGTDFESLLKQRDPRVEESILKSAAERHGNMRGYAAGLATQSRTENAERSRIAEAMAYREEDMSTMRLVRPLESFDEQIAALGRRVLQATDSLANHTSRVLGPIPCEGIEDLVRDRPAGALDRITESIGALEGAVVYLENEVNRATGLA